MDDLATAMRGVHSLSREMGQAVASSMWGFVLALHRPVDVAGDGSGPAICPICKTEWPCDATVRATDERARLVPRREA